MSRELFLMMSNDERLTLGEIEHAIKHVLARTLKSRRKLSLRPSMSESHFRSRTPLLQQRSYSPDLIKSTIGGYPTEPLTPTQLDTSSGEDRVSVRERSATNVFDHPKSSAAQKNLCEGYADTPFEYEIIESAFLKLYERLKDTDGARRAHDGQPEIHVSNIKQFFLESYVNSQTSLNEMLSPFKTAKWIDLRGFTASIESIQQINYDHPFFNRDELATTKNNLIRQKLLCDFHLVFYKLADLDQKNALSKFDVKIISGMALRAKKKISSDNLDMVVQRAFEKANELRGFASDFITFEEFLSVLKN